MFFRSIAFGVVVTAAVPTTLASQQFGSAVAISGDDVLVAQPQSQRGSGTVYLFRRSGEGTWAVVSRLRASDGVMDDGFGQSVAVRGTRLIVAAGEEGGAPAYVFERDAAGVWSEVARLEPAGLAREPRGAVSPQALVQSLRFGPARRTVALGADMALVANWGGNTEEEAVFVYRRSTTGSWAQEAMLIADDGQRRDRFGATLAVSAGRAVVGAPSHGASGAVYVFVRGTDGKWRREAKLAASGLPSGSRFGAALAATENELAIGAPGANRSAGAVVVFRRDNAPASWTLTERLAPPDSAAGQLFGAAVSLGTRELWVGAPRGGGGSGLVFHYVRHEAADGWGSGTVVQASDAVAGDLLGGSVAHASDIAVVGAPGADRFIGEAIVFSRTGNSQGYAAATIAGDDESLPAIVGGEVPCDEGKSASFTCHEVDLLAFLPITALGGERGTGVTDHWGWRDPETGRDYVLVGRSDGTAFVDITDPSNPVYVAELPSPPEFRGGLRDIKVYSDHAFIVADGGAQPGMWVFDLARLRGLTGPPPSFGPDARYDGIRSAHNLVVNTETGFAYTVGSSGGGETCGGGLHMVDIRDPQHPTFAGCFVDPTHGLIAPGRTHDAQCVVYRGPDEEHRNKEICIASNETALTIVDVSDKSAPAIIALMTYPGISYVHQGWLTGDQRYFFLDDELDELTGVTETTRTLVFDVSDLDDPVLLTEYHGPTGATDHNLYVRGDRMYQANYVAGLRVLDIRDAANPVEVGYFDTMPFGVDKPGFAGAWTAYPFHESGVVTVTSMSEGLFILRPRATPLMP